MRLRVILMNVFSKNDLFSIADAVRGCGEKTEVVRSERDPVSGTCFLTVDVVDPDLFRDAFRTLECFKRCLGMTPAGEGNDPLLQPLKVVGSA